MNRSYILVVGLFLIGLFFFWRHFLKGRQEQALILGQLKRYPLLQRAWTVALADQSPIVSISDLSTGIPGSTITKNKLEPCQQMTPQGLALSKEWLFISMYCGDHQHHSLIMIVDRHSGKHIKNVILPKRPHVGGLAYDSEEGLLWITITGRGCGRVGSLSFNQLLMDDSEQTGVPVHFQSILDLEKLERASYLTAYRQELVAGSFALKKAGGIAYYSLRQTTDKEEIESKDQIMPRIQVTTPTKVQAVAFYQEWLFLARSYGPGSSEILVFPKEETTLSRKTVSYRIKCPPYLEQIVVEKDYLYCLFESGATRYRHKTAWPIDEILVLDIPTLLQKKTGFKRNRPKQI